MKRNVNSYAGTKLQVEVSMPGLVRIGAYTRIQNGRPVKVRSYFRRSWEAEVLTIRICTRLGSHLPSLWLGDSFGPPFFCGYSKVVRNGLMVRFLMFGFMKNPERNALDF